MVNDISIAAAIIISFICIGVFLPYVQEEFNLTETNINIDGYNEQIGESAKNIGTLTALDIVLSIFKMFFWTFGSIVWWLDLTIFMSMRIILALIIARNVWIGGGA